MLKEMIFDSNIFFIHLLKVSEKHKLRKLYERNRLQRCFDIGFIYLINGRGGIFYLGREKGGGIATG